jgi:hypothetical protein
MHPAVDGAPPPARALNACVCAGIVNKRQRRKTQGCKWKMLPFMLARGGRVRGIGMERRFGTWLDRRTMLCRAVLTCGSKIVLHYAKVSPVDVNGTGIPRLNEPEVPKITVAVLHRIRRQADRRSFRRGLLGRGNSTPARRRACIRRGGAETQKISKTSKVEDVHASTPQNETQRTTRSQKEWPNTRV